MSVGSESTRGTARPQSPLAQTTSLPNSDIPESGKKFWMAETAGGSEIDDFGAECVWSRDHRFRFGLRWKSSAQSSGDSALALLRHPELLTDSGFADFEAGFAGFADFEAESVKSSGWPGQSWTSGIFGCRGLRKTESPDDLESRIRVRFRFASEKADSAFERNLESRIRIALRTWARGDIAFAVSH